MQPLIHKIFESDFFELINFQCQCNICAESKRVYNHKFSISFISRGNFYYHTFCEQLDAYTGYALISKPDYEYRVTHPTEEADECSVFSFSLDFYKSLEEQLPYNTKWFFNNKDIQSMLIKLTPEIEYLHKVCIHAIENNMPALYVDALVIEIVQQLLQSLNQETTQIIVSDRLKKSHIITIELAKNYILQNFTTDISLKDIAAHSFVSPFHFSKTETPITLIILLLIGSMVLIQNNRKAFMLSHVFIGIGFIIAGFSTYLFTKQLILPYWWMTLVGLGLYMVYIPFNSVYFERLIATFRFTGNVGFLIYVADSFGYLGSVSVLVSKEVLKIRLNWVDFFSTSVMALSLAGILITGYAMFYFGRKSERQKVRKSEE